MRVNFYSVFKPNPDGSYSPTANIKFDGVHINLSDTLFPGTRIASFDVGHHVGRELDITTDTDGYIELNAIY